MVPKVIEAPLEAGQELGELVLSLHDEEVIRAPLVTLEAAPEAGFFSRFGDGVYLFFSDFFD